MKKHIGVTLVFYCNNTFTGIQSCYIFELKSLELLLIDIENKAKENINKFLPNFDFLGVSDLYMTEDLSAYNFLGRTSYFDMKEECETQKIIVSNDILCKDVSEITRGSLINVGLVYFNKDSEGSEFNSTMIIYTIIDEFNGMDLLYKSLEVSEFVKKIIKYSAENLMEEDLIFKGISDLYSVKNEGLFELEGVFENKEEVINEVLSFRQLEKKFNSLRNDYMHIK